MRLHMVGCHQRRNSLDFRERLAFAPEQAQQALTSWRERFPHTEAVLLSTCNRVEFYAAAAADAARPSLRSLTQHLADFHCVSLEEVKEEVVSLQDEEVVRHLFRVAASLDSMVVGEPQILSQVKQAYEMARDIGSTGPLTHRFFQSALRTARRVASETTLHQHRVSIPSVGVADFASRVFGRFDDKRILVLGAGEMAEETLHYLIDAGARHLTVVNRNLGHAEILAKKWGGVAVTWDQLYQKLAAADLVISTTAAQEPVVTRQTYRELVSTQRHQRPLFILDLAVPRDFEPSVGDELGTYLYSIDDLSKACERNLQARRNALPQAEQIIDEETLGFLAESHHRANAPIISQLTSGFRQTQREELARLLNKLPDLDQRTKQEIEQFSDRLVAKLLHPPLESLRDESKNGSPKHLLEALCRLFQLKE